MGNSCFFGVVCLTFFTGEILLCLALFAANILLLFLDNFSSYSELISLVSDNSIASFNLCLARMKSS